MAIVYALVAYWGYCGYRGFGGFGEYGRTYFPEQVSLALRLQLFAWSTLLPACMLVVSIGRLANHRFGTPQDIHGSGLTVGTERAKLLQALLQNTLEQCVLAFTVYLAGSLLLPAPLLGWVPAASIMFLTGRLLFFAGYQKGAPGRALGFGLTFYPTVIMLVALILSGLIKLIS